MLISTLCLYSVFFRRPALSFSPHFYRSVLSLQPVTEGDSGLQREEFECSEGFSYEDSNKPHFQQTCCHHGDQGVKIIVNIVPVKDTVTFKNTGDAGENYDVPFVLHLWPSVLLHNQLPYQITYRLKVGLYAYQ